MKEFYQAIQSGLYSDFEVCIGLHGVDVGEKSYKLHKFVLGGKSKFFAGLFNTKPNDTRVVFDADHLIARDPDLWDCLVKLWYGNIEKIYCENPEKFFQITDLVADVCEYLITPSPKIEFPDITRSNFLSGIDVCHSHSKNGSEIRFSVDKTSHVSLSSLLKGPFPGSPETSIQEAVDLFNRYIEERMGVSHVISTLHFLEKNPGRSGEWPWLLLNGHGYSAEKYYAGHTDVTLPFRELLWFLLPSIWKRRRAECLE